MLSRIADRNIWLIYIAILTLSTAYGVSLALTALQLDAAGFSKRDIGTLAAIFATGIVTLALPMGKLLERVPAKMALVACLLVYAACVGAFPFQTTYAGVAVVRFGDGAASVGTWIACETILLARSDASTKALVMSLYAMAMAVGYLTGAVLAKLIYAATGSMPAGFVTAGVLTLVAALLLAMKLERDEPLGKPHPAQRHSSDAARPLASARLLFRVKTSCLATFAYGYFQASVVLFLPLYLIETKRVPKGSTMLIPAIFSLGMLLLSSYAGRLGDRVGQLRVMRLLAAIGCAMVFGFVLLSSWAAMCVAIFIAGASLGSISPLSLALQGHIAQPRDYGRATAMYNLFYAAGMLVGPPLSSVLFDRGGGASMLIHLALLWAGFIVFALVFAKDDPAERKRAAARVVAQPELNV